MIVEPPAPLVSSDSPLYGADAHQRFVAEAPKDEARTDFERDRARILHSSGLRRLGTKTQVLGPSSDDFVRTRLTHSLEVAQVGRELGKELGCDPDIVDAACLAHDLGHPPFGHNGERALDEVAAAIGGFEGNAQTFRLVVRLEAKIYQDDLPRGLNLTRATLDAICKYPWLRGEGPDPVKSARKFGVYGDDEPIFAWMREDAPRWQRCLEAQVMDFADDVGYSVHDLEDAVVTKRCDIALLQDPQVRQDIVDSTVAWYGASVSPEGLALAAERLTALPYWPSQYSDSYRGRSAIKDLTSQLIGRFCAAVVTSTREQFGEGALGRYRADLVIPPETVAEIAFLKGVAVHFVMSPREHEPVYFQQRTIVFDLVDALMNGGPDLLEGPFAEEWQRGDSDGAHLRAVVDQVACLTDFSASAWHARLCGMLSSQL